MYSVRTEALRRDIGRRLSICDADEVRVIDLVLMSIEAARSQPHSVPLLETDGNYTAEEKAYRRGHNDAMRSESTSATVWRHRLLLVTRDAEVERGLAELVQNAEGG